MSRRGGSSQIKAQPFNAKQYAKNGLTEDEVSEVK